MTPLAVSEIFTKETLEKLFPSNRADQFFEALYGDASEGAYDISLNFTGMNKDRLNFEFSLKQRPGKCLACNLTYGLPTVFSRHPLINLNGLAKEIDGLLGEQASCSGWKIGTTQEVNHQLHVLPVSFMIS